MRAFMVFLLHQLLSTVVVIVGSALLVFSGTSLLHLFQPQISNKAASLLLTTLPEFPIQTAVGLLLGWILMKHFKHGTALWVWVLPAIVMLAVLVHGPIAEYGNHMNSTVFSHFFGGACRPQDRCLDQIIFTLPLCAALGYSLGAAWARSQKKGAAVFAAASA